MPSQVAQQNMDPTSNTTSPIRPVTHGRQRPGAACEECRRRKLRCDGQQPQCGVCQESGLVCEINTQRALRGPKKGYLKALKNRVAMLENRLAAQNHDEGNLETSIVTPPPTELVDTVTDPILTDFDQFSLPTRSASVSDSEIFFTHPLSGMNTPPGSSITSTANPVITDLMQAELDQLYFDRIHISIQILHQRRYLAWSRSNVKKTSQVCLQHAIWTLASLMSAQFQYLQESLYQSTKQMLEYLSLSNSEQDAVDTEQAQAWILVAIYESMRTYNKQAWMSAGRAFRLVQLMRFHEIDMPNNGPIPESQFIETEEKRCVFWAAYFLDHIFSIRNNWPITLNEHVICTRLPSRESELQNRKHHVLGSFLSEAIMEQSPRIRSPVNECVILATICGRSLFHGQQYNVRCIYGDVAPGWSDHHQWLDSILTKRLQILSECYPSPSEICDPLLLFVNIMGQATIIYLCKGMESVLCTVDEGCSLVVEYQQRALAAAEQIISLAKQLTEFHFFKVHPLMPIPLALCAEFLYHNRSSHESFSLRLQELLDIFRQLKNVNNPNQSYMDLLELSGISAAPNMTKDRSSL